MAKRRTRAEKDTESYDLHDRETAHPRTKAEDDFLELARDRFKSAQSAEKDQRQRELDDIRFYDGDQWPDDVRVLRAGQNANNGLPPVPARPMITINETRAPVRNVLNQERNSDLGIELVPADDFGDLDDTPENKAEIELREGLIRRLQRESYAKDARTWAFSRAVIAGRGYYMVSVRFLPGKTMDQEVYVSRIYNQAAVTIDPNHQNPDGSDAEWEFLGAFKPWSTYKREHPTTADGRPNPIIDATDSDFRALGEEYPLWFKAEGDERAVHVATYFYADYVDRELVEWSDGQVFWANEEPQEFPPGVARAGEPRRVLERKIKWATIDGRNILEASEPWLSDDMPIIQILGEELHPYDEQKRAEGMVRPARGANEGLNYMVSKWVEMVGLTPIPPLFVAEGQIEGYEKWYEAAATRVLPYLPYRTRDLEGNPVGPPNSVDRSTPIQAVAASVQMFNEKIQTTMNVHDPSLGKTDPALRSGAAINSVIAADQHGTSNFLDNLVRSMEYEGKVENNLLYPVYGRKPGRLARILNQENEPETIQVGAGDPTAAVPTRQGKPVRQFPLTKNARFNVAIKVSKNYDTRRQQEAAVVGEILAANPANMMVIGDLFFKNLDGPGHDEMAERYKLMLDPKIQQMIADKQTGQQPIPPQLQQKMAEAEQLVQTMQQVIEQLEQEKAAKTAETQGKIQIEQIAAEKDIELQRMKDMTVLQKTEQDNETKLQIAGINSKLDELMLQFKEREQITGRAHEAAINTASAANDQQLSADAHQQTLQQQQQQAALQPPAQEPTA